MRDEGRDRSFGSRARSSGPGAAPRILLAVVPVGLYLAHLAYGANQAVAAQILTAVLALGLCIVMATPLRKSLAALDGLDVAALLFTIVLAMALLSLSPFSPGDPHPIWAWAGVTPGSGTINRSATLLEIVKLLGLACAFVVGAMHGARKDRAQATVEAIIWAGGVYSAVSLILFGARLQASMGQDRLAGGFLSANSAATVFGILVVLSLAQFLRAWRRSEGLGFTRMLTKVAAPVACLTLAVACIVLTASRMGLAATGLAAAVLLAWEMVGNRRGRAGIAVAALAAAIAGVVLVLGASSTMLDRFGSIGSDSNLRSVALDAHWNAFLASPLTGNGLGSFDQVNLQILTAANVDSLWSIRAAHNVYLQWLEEAGILGAAPMFILIALVIGQAFKRGTGSRSGLTQQHGLICGNLVVLIHAMTDYGLQVPSVAAFWAFLLGLQFAFGASRS